MYSVTAPVALHLPVSSSSNKMPTFPCITNVQVCLSVLYSRTPLSGKFKSVSKQKLHFLFPMIPRMHCIFKKGSSLAYLPPNPLTFHAPPLILRIAELNTLRLLSWNSLSTASLAIALPFCCLFTYFFFVALLSFLITALILTLLSLLFLIFCAISIILFLFLLFICLLLLSRSLLFFLFRFHFFLFLVASPTPPPSTAFKPTAVGN